MMLKKITDDLDDEDGLHVCNRMDGSLLNLLRIQACTKIHERLFRDILFADDAALVTHTNQDLQRIISCFIGCLTAAWP